MKRFTVIDTHTGEYPDLWSLARRCKWAKHLCYCDMEGFAVEEDGTVLLLDECGKYGIAPNDRFKIVWEEEPAKTMSNRSDEYRRGYIHGKSKGIKRGLKLRKGFVRVVRCKDCENYEPFSIRGESTGIGSCDLIKLEKPVKEDWFCADGRERQGE